MIASIIAALASLFKIVAEFMRQSRDKLLLTLGGTQQEAASLRERLKAIQEANRAREQARADMNRDPTGGRDSDEFTRSDKEGEA
jgi:hypothetical protein